MGFKSRDLQSTVKVSDTPVKKFIIIICEGEKTEFQYFSGLEKLELPVKNLIILEPIKHASAPTRLANSYVQRKEEIRQKKEEKEIVAYIEKTAKQAKENKSFKDNYDSVWIVVDRETQENKIVNIERAQKICDEKNYNMALTNPTFEFWLLLHIVDISQYDTNRLNEIAENKKINKKKKKRFLEKKLSEILGGYNKSELKQEDFISLEKILFALKQEEFIAIEINDIKKNIGSNIGKLIHEIIDVELAQTIVNDKTKEAELLNIVE